MKLNRLISFIKWFAALLLYFFATQIYAKNLNDEPLANKRAEQILLAQVYRSGIDISQYLVSEKYDGVRALWDGKSLHTRAGRSISASIGLSLRTAPDSTSN